MIIILPCCWCPGKYDISSGYNVKDTGLDPLHSVLPGLGHDALPERPSAGTYMLPVFVLAPFVVIRDIPLLFL